MGQKELLLIALIVFVLVLFLLWLTRPRPPRQSGASSAGQRVPVGGASHYRQEAGQDWFRERDHARRKHLARQVLSGDPEVAQQLLQLAGLGTQSPRFAAQDDPSIEQIARKIPESQLQALHVASQPQQQFEAIDLDAIVRTQQVDYPTHDVRIEPIDDPGELHRVLAEELVLDEEQFYAKYAEQSLAVAQPYDNVVEHRRLHILLDISSSMSGSMSGGYRRIVWAAGVALRLLYRAKRGEAQYMLRYFDDRPHQLITIETPAQAEAFIRQLVRLQAGGGGTSIQLALQQAVADIAQGKDSEDIDADVLLISDGESALSKDWLRETFKGNLRLHAALIGKSSPVLQEVAKTYREY